MQNRGAAGRLRLLACAAVVGWSAPCLAQDANLDFPPIGGGYDQQFVPVQARARPLYDQPGIHLGGFEISPNLDQNFGYDTNPTASPTDSGSALSHTSAQVAANSLWSRDSISAQIGTDHYSYFNIPGADYTDWNVGLQGGYTLGDSNLTAAYAHQSYHQLGAAIGTTRSDTPAADQTDTAELYKMFGFYRIDLTPDVSYSLYRYGDATAGGQRLDQRYLNRNVLSGGLTARYRLNDIGGIVAVARAVDTQYPYRTAGQPTLDSRSVELLTGLDYRSEGLWHFSLLVGAEVSTFTAAEYATRTSPIVEGDVTWTPTGLTTVTGTVRRAINDPQSAGTNGYVLTQGNLRVDHELRRNVILQASGGVQYAEYLQNGAQTSFNLGCNASWLLNRNIRISLSYDFTRQSGASGASSMVGLDAPDVASYNRSVIGTTLHLGL